MESVVKSKKYVVPLAVLNPEITAGLVVAYLTDGRFKAPKDATVEIIPGETVTKGVEPAPAATSGTGSGAGTGAVETRRPLPLPTTPQ
jgi:predicted RecA/RadA family phage recombinase